MSDTNFVQKAETALDAADKILSNPQAGSYENAAVVALIGIGYAILAAGKQIRSGG